MSDPGYAERQAERDRLAALAAANGTTFDVAGWNDAQAQKAGNANAADAARNGYGTYRPAQNTMATAQATQTVAPWAPPTPTYSAPVPSAMNASNPALSPAVTPIAPIPQQAAPVAPITPNISAAPLLAPGMAGTQNDPRINPSAPVPGDSGSIITNYFADGQRHDSGAGGRIQSEMQKIVNAQPGVDLDTAYYQAVANSKMPEPAPVPGQPAPAQPAAVQPAAAAPVAAPVAATPPAATATPVTAVPTGLVPFLSRDKDGNPVVVQVSPEIKAEALAAQTAQAAASARALQFTQGIEQGRLDIEKLTQTQTATYQQMVLSGNDKRDAQAAATQAMQIELQKQTLELNRQNTAQTAALQREQLAVAQKNAAGGGRRRIQGVRYR